MLRTARSSPPVRRRGCAPAAGCVGLGRRELDPGRPRTGRGSGRGSLPGRGRAGHRPGGGTAGAAHLPPAGGNRAAGGGWGHRGRPPRSPVRGRRFGGVRFGGDGFDGDRFDDRLLGLPGSAWRVGCRWRGCWRHRLPDDPGDPGVRRVERLSTVCVAPVRHRRWRRRRRPGRCAVCPAANSGEIPSARVACPMCPPEAPGAASSAPAACPICPPAESDSPTASPGATSTCSPCGATSCFVGSASDTWAFDGTSFQPVPGSGTSAPSSGGDLAWFPSPGCWPDLPSGPEVAMGVNGGSDIARAKDEPCPIFPTGEVCGVARAPTGHPRRFVPRRAVRLRRLSGHRSLHRSGRRPRYQWRYVARRLTRPRSWKQATPSTTSAHATEPLWPTTGAPARWSSSDGEAYSTESGSARATTTPGPGTGQDWNQRARHHPASTSASASPLPYPVAHGVPCLRPRGQAPRPRALRRR